MPDNRMFITEPLFTDEIRFYVNFNNYLAKKLNKFYKICYPLYLYPGGGIEVEKSFFEFFLPDLWKMNNNGMGNSPDIRATSCSVRHDPCAFRKRECVWRAIKPAAGRLWQRRLGIDDIRDIMTHHAWPAHQTGGAALKLKTVEIKGRLLVEVWLNLTHVVRETEKWNYSAQIT